MPAKQDKWLQFCKTAAATMRGALKNKITLETAAKFFEADKSISDPRLRRYVESMIWEIDGSPAYYEELLKLFETKATEKQMIQYLDTKKAGSRK